MSAIELPLDRLQRWMQQVVVHPGTPEQAVASPEAQAELPLEQLPDVILRSATLTPTERVGIYQGMYLLRMHEALQSDHAGLEHFLGEHRFFELITGYVQVYPSRSYSLNRLGDHMPEYIESLPHLPRREFCVDLARLELAAAQVFDAEETPALTADEIAAVAPEGWEHATLAPIAGFQLLALRYPASAYLDSFKRDDHEHPKLVRKNSWVAVYRRDYSVWRLDLTRAGHDLLADIVAGTPLGRALRAAMARGRHAPSEDELFRWFRHWVSGGIFRSVSLNPP